MKSLYDQSAFNEIIDRINKLNASSERQWGKMNAAQMLAHCNEAFKVPLSNKPLPRMFMGILFGWMMKHKLSNDEPWKKNLPTAPNFLIKDDKNFEKEKQQLISFINEFYSRGASDTGKYPHPFFGKLSSEEWGKSMYKHLNHHLTQFGV